MAGTLTIILGLCGSGKSWTLDGLDVDVKGPHDGFATDRRHFHRIVDALRSGKSCGIIEIAYCNPIPRMAFEQELRGAVPDVNIEYICFENDLPKANANCEGRDDGRDVQMLYAINRQFSVSYTIPPSAEVRPIWTPK